MTADRDSGGTEGANPRMPDRRHQTRSLPGWSLRFLAISAGLVAAASSGGHADEGRLVLEDFTLGGLGAFPTGWHWRGKDDAKPKRYAVREEAGRRFLNAKDDSQSVIIFKEVSWRLRDYPILTWRWRVKSLPPGGDERIGEKNDSAAGLYVVFSKSWLRIPRQIKYVWSSTLPRGTVADRRLIGRPRVLVVRSGLAGVGEWKTERANLLEDYRRIWGGEPEEMTVGIAILTDADATHTFAEADYADIVASRE